MDSLLKQFSQSSQLGANAAYIEDLYEQYLVSPDSVGPKWKAYFDGFKGREAGDVPHSAVIDADCRGRQGRPRAARLAAADRGRRRRARARRRQADHRLPFARPPRRQSRSARHAREARGARTSTLGFHRLSESDLGAEFSTGGVAGKERMKLGDLLALLKATYTGPIGAEFMHIADAEQRRWMYERLEARRRQVRPHAPTTSAASSSA